MDERQSFYDELRGELDMHSADDSVVCLGDFNGQVGRHIDGGYGLGKRNLEENVTSVLPAERIVCVKYKVKRRGKRKVTFSLGENETKI